MLGKVDWVIIHSELHIRLTSSKNWIHGLETGEIRIQMSDDVVDYRYFCSLFIQLLVALSSQRTQSNTTYLYADDTQLYISFTPSNSTSSLEMLSNTFSDILSWMNSNKLLLNPSKTEFLLIGTKQQRLKYCQSEQYRLKSSLGKRHLANERMGVSETSRSELRKITGPSPCKQREIRTRQADANLMWDSKEWKYMGSSCEHCS